MYATTNTHRSAARRAADVPGQLKTAYSGILSLVALKDAWNRADSSGSPDPNDLALYNYINSLYDEYEVPDMFACIDDLAATITDWETDHAELLAM